MHYDVLIIGAGPGGLTCATKLAQENIKVLVVDRKSVVGPKACAGGITWNGIIQRVPEHLIEQSFKEQTIITRFQNICVSEKHPIIATVNRRNLGQFMAQEALKSGADIATSGLIESISNNSAVLHSLTSQKRYTVYFDYLVGADGATSKVRRYLNIPTKYTGTGVNFQVEGSYKKMEWHLLTQYFHSGYGWIFPHKSSFSIGAYIPHGIFSGSALKNRTLRWAEESGIDLNHLKCSAGYINYDYRGYQFDRTFLVGDAAGLASALTGEGIYPAIVSGEAVAKKIINPSGSTPEMDRLIQQQQRFKAVTTFSSRSKYLSTFLAEIASLALHYRLINFKMFEMCN
jgi:menaquinone-9 beta-reductase